MMSKRLCSGGEAWELEVLVFFGTKSLGIKSRGTQIQIPLTCESLLDVGALVIGRGGMGTGKLNDVEALDDVIVVQAKNGAVVAEWRSMSEYGGVMICVV